MRAPRRAGVRLAVGMLVLVSALTRVPAVQAAGGLAYTVAPGGVASCVHGHQVGDNFARIQQALNCARADNPSASNPDTIKIAAGTYHEALTVEANVVLQGSGPATTIINPTFGNEPVVTTPRQADTFEYSLIGLSLVHGNSSYGAGVRNIMGTVTIKNTDISYDVVASSTGEGGGAVFNGPGATMTIADSQIHNDRSGADGGGIKNRGTMTITNSRISRNTSGGGGGGIANLGTLTVIGTTVTDNSAPFGAGIATSAHAHLTLTDTSVSGNHPEQTQCDGC